MDYTQVITDLLIKIADYTEFTLTPSDLDKGVVNQCIAILKGVYVEGITFGTNCGKDVGA